MRNTSSRMCDLGNAFSFQYSIGDAAFFTVASLLLPIEHLSILHWRCSRRSLGRWLCLMFLSFQYSIGDARARRQLHSRLRHGGACFQYSIGDALAYVYRRELRLLVCPFNTPLEMLRSPRRASTDTGALLSILHWRCPEVYERIARLFEELSILHWRCVI